MFVTINQKKSYLFAVILLLYVFAYLLQTSIYIHGDISWGLHASRLLLAGGSYFKDIFDVSPPLMLYHYSPPVLIAKISGINIFTVFRCYIFVLISVSLYLSYLLIKKIFANQTLAGSVFFIALAFLLLLFPQHEFGQKEHLLFIFVMPYFCLMASRLQGEKINSYFALIIGLFAALGFAIKPHFLISLVLIELYYMSVKRSILAWLRPEVYGLLSFCFLYAIVVFIFHQEYLYRVTPIILRLFYAGIASSWQALFINRVVFFSILAVIFYVLQFKNNRYHYLHTILFLGLLGFLMSYFFQRAAWSYRALPAFCMANLLLVLSFILFWSESNIKKGSYFFLITLMTLSFAYPIWYFTQMVNRSVITEKTVQKPLIQFIHQYAENKAVYFFSTNVLEQYPAVDYGGAMPVPRFAAFLVMLPGITKEKLSYPEGKIPQQLKEDENTFVNLVTNDIKTKKPYLVFVSNKPYPVLLPFEHFDYIHYFSKNAAFIKEWNSYHYFKTVQFPEQATDHPVYRFDVYRRDEL